MGIATQARVLTALIVRDMMMRYGRNNIGFLWVVLEPMILTIGVMFIWSIAKSPYEHGLEVIAIVMTGYMPLTLFRHLTNSATHLYRRSVPFLYHRHISFIDILVARSILEFTGTTIALIVVYAALVLSGFSAPIYDPALVIAGWFLMAALSFGLASVIAVVTELSDASERFIQPFQYLVVPVSGCFFMVEWMPKTVQELLWFMPLVHCFEMFRAGFFGDGVTTHYTFWYPSLWALALTTFGIGKIESARERIQTG